MLWGIGPEANKEAEIILILEMEIQHIEKILWSHRCQWVVYKSKGRRRPVRQAFRMKACTSLGSWSSKYMAPKSSYRFSNTSIYRTKPSTSSKLHSPLGSMVLVRWAHSISIIIRANICLTTMPKVCSNQRACSAKTSFRHLTVKQGLIELTTTCHILTQNTNLRTNISCPMSRKNLVKKSILNTHQLLKCIWLFYLPLRSCWRHLTRSSMMYFHQSAFQKNSNKSRKASKRKRSSSITDIQLPTRRTSSLLSEKTQLVFISLGMGFRIMKSFSRATKKAGWSTRTKVMF